MAAPTGLLTPSGVNSSVNISNPSGAEVNGAIVPPGNAAALAAASSQTPTPTLNAYGQPGGVLNPVAPGTAPTPGTTPAGTATTSGLSQAPSQAPAVYTSDQAQGNLAQAGSAYQNVSSGVQSQAATVANANYQKAQAQQQQNATPGAGSATDGTQGSSGSTGTANQPITVDDLNSAIDSLTNQETQAAQDSTDEQAQVSQQRDQAFQNVSQQITQLSQGTFPLSPAEQAQVNAVSNQYAQLVSQQQTTNSQFEAGTLMAAVTSGLQRYAPQMALGQVQDAVSSGIAQVADIEQKGAAALGTLESALQKNDYDMIQGAYTDLVGSLDAKSKAIADTTTATQTALKDAVANYQKQQTDYMTMQQNAITNSFKAQTLSDTEKNDLFNQTLSSDKFTETQKQDVVDNYYKGVTAQHEEQSIGIQQENAGIALAHLQLDQQTAADTENNDAAAVLNGVNKTPSGSTYIDGTGFTAAQKALAVQNGQVVLGGDDLKAIQGVTGVTQQFGTLLTSLQNAGVLNSNFQFTISKNFVGAVSNKGESTGAFQDWPAGSAEPAVQSFTTNLKSTISDLSKLPNTGDLVQTLSSNEFAKGDNAVQMQQKIVNITNALASTENSILSKNLPSNQAPTQFNLNGKILNLQPDGSYE